jgi:hypothetical protein
VKYVSDVVGNPTWHISKRGVREWNMTVAPIYAEKRLLQLLAGPVAKVATQFDDLLVVTGEALSESEPVGAILTPLIASSGMADYFGAVCALPLGDGWTEVPTEGVVARDLHLFLTPSIATQSAALLRMGVSSQLPAVLSAGGGNIWLEAGAEDGREGITDYFRDLPL